MPIFGDVLPVCCIWRKHMKWKWYKFWGHYHEYGDNTCMHCGMPVYQRYDKQYNGYLGFCTTCEATWAES